MLSFKYPFAVFFCMAIEKTNPPKPLTLLAFFTFIVFSGTFFVILPVVFGLLSVFSASVELMLSPNNVSGDFSNIVIGQFLWDLAWFPFTNWLITLGIVIVGTAGFVMFTKYVNKKK